MRKYYIDNLRWSAIAVLIVYHAAMAWNTWDEPNYIFFEGNRAISAVVVSFSLFLMSLLFVLAGISTKYALTKRTIKQYVLERVRKLLIPFVFGTIVLMPVLSYLADRFNCNYQGSFFEHYAVFFTKFTDMTGADGGFSVGQFWFLIYLFVISVIFIGIYKIQQTISRGNKKTDIPLFAICLLGVPILLFHELLPIGGKSLIEYFYLFLLGYYILSDDNVVTKLSSHKWVLLTVGIISAAATTYLFLWSDQAVPIINSVTRSMAEWFIVPSAIGLSNSYWSNDSAITKYMSQRSFIFYIFHFVWIVLFQYLFADILSGSILLMYLVPVILAYIMTLLSCEICIRIPILCFLMGTKPLKK